MMNRTFYILTHIHRCLFDSNYQQLFHHAVHAVSIFGFNTRTRADLHFLVLTPRKGTSRTLLSTFKIANGLPKSLRYLQYGFPQTFVMGIRPLQTP